MQRADALIVGGGPAGSTCARTLQRAGWNVVVLDRARFPRDKVCGGWVTPEVFELLDLSPADYRATGFTIQEITGFKTRVFGQPAVETRYDDVISYAIRRCEFDGFLLKRTGACIVENTALTSLQRRGGSWIVNDRFDTPIVVGAGGHFCPVARHLQGERDRTLPVIAREAEFPVDGASSIAGEIPELFFSRDLEGYGWCVRKGDYLNVGIGRRAHEDFAAHCAQFQSFLAAKGYVIDPSRLHWRGHAYHAMGVGTRPLAGDGVLLVGDAAGLAYPESGEGIRPAVESGLVAARTLIAADGRFNHDTMHTYEAVMRARHAPLARPPEALRPLSRFAGRALLRSKSFTRRVVLDSWFLRTTSPTVDDGGCTRTDCR
jgi:geranylgeranyl reductase family protein